MRSEFLFVNGLESGDQRQKELVYAACKAHVAKVTHRKRRKASKEGQMWIRTSKHVHKPRTEPAKPAACGSDDGKNGPWSILVKTHPQKTTDQRTEPASKLYTDALTLWSGRNAQLGNPSVAISPQLNNAIVFVQLHLTGSQAPTFVLRLLGNKQWASTLKQETEVRSERWLWELWAQNAGLFSSVVASVIPLMVRLAPVEEASRLETMSMDLKNESFAHLRDLLAHGASQPNVDLSTVAYYVKSLFRESCARGDVQAAQCHLGMLEQLVTKMTDRNIDCSRVALWSDALPALLQMRRPIQGRSSRITCIIQQVCIEAEKVLPATDLVNTKAPACMVDQTLQEAFLHLRKALYVTHVTVVADENEQKQRTEKLFQWLTMKAEHHVCRLLEFFFDLTSFRGSVRRCILSQGSKYMDICFALCLLHLYQKSFFEIKQADGRDIHESAFMIYPLLRSCVQLAETYLTAPEQVFYENTIFWVLFVGANAEERLCHPSSSILKIPSQIEAEDLWFRSRLVQESARRKIVCWFDATTILEQFVWDKSLNHSEKVTSIFR